MLKHLPNRVDPLVGRDVVDDQVDDPAPIDFLAMVQGVREFQEVSLRSIGQDLRTPL
jgi:hypothetical protein